MISNNPIPAVCNYGSAAVYRCEPSPEQIRMGVVPLDSLPAAWWNCMWFDTNRAINCARYAAGILIDEVNTVLDRAGVCVNPTAVDQLYQAIDKMKAIIGTDTIAGSVKSSSNPGEVSINPTTGIMTANCVGNAAALATSARTLVGAVNELKATYDASVTSINGTLTSLNNSKAPVYHASPYTTYGIGDFNNFGHLKITDVYWEYQGAAANGLTISQWAAWCVYNLALQSSIALSDSAPAALGTAWAGVSGYVSRADHVHPIPAWIECAGAIFTGRVNQDGNVTSSDNYVVWNNTGWKVLLMPSGVIINPGPGTYVYTNNACNQSYIFGW